MSRSAGLVAVLAAAATASAVIVAMRPAEPIRTLEPGPQTVALTNATLSCPSTPDGRASEDSLFAVSLGERDGEAGGAADISVLDGTTARAFASLRRPGIPNVQRLSVAEGVATTITAEGTFAPGLTGAQWSGTAGGSSTGLAVTACQAPAAGWWFSGVDTSVGSSSRLVLTNPTPSTAVVDLGFYAPEGPVAVVGGRGVAVAPWSTRVLDLSGYAPGLDAVTLEVSAPRGRVVAATYTDKLAADHAAGSDWVAASSPPATHLVVNAGHDGAGDKTLVITNPGDREALVQGTLLDSGGPFVPSQLAELRVGPGQVLVTDITGIAQDQSAAVSLTSSAPIVAGLVDSAVKPADFSTTGSSPPLTTPAVVPLIVGTTLKLAFSSSVRSGGKVVIDAFDDRGGTVSSQPLNLRGLTTQTWRAPTGRDVSYLRVSVAVEADIRAVALYAGKQGIAALPVLSAETTVTLPQVRAAP